MFSWALIRWSWILYQRGFDAPRAKRALAITAVLTRLALLSQGFDRNWTRWERVMPRKKFNAERIVMLLRNIEGVAAALNACVPRVLSLHRGVRSRRP